MHDRKENTRHYNLFLDDERMPNDVCWVKIPSVKWDIVRSYKEFVEIIKRDGLPKHVSFDHDLAEEHYREYTRVSNESKIMVGGPKFHYDQMKEKTGYDAAKWLVDYCIEWDLDLPEYTIHTMNPVGGLNIKSTLEAYRKYREDERSKTSNDDWSTR